MGGEGGGRSGLTTTRVTSSPADVAVMEELVA